MIPARLSQLLRCSAFTLAVLAAMGGWGNTARANASLASMVRSFCLTAFEAEMARAGKTPPPGMANFACGCVADKIQRGSSLEAARSSCRDATVRRYPI